MADYTKYPKVYVKPAINPETVTKDNPAGEPYYTWHPSAFRQALPREGAWVPNDPDFTGRMLKDGSWLEATPPADEAPKKPKASPAPASPV